MNRNEREERVAQLTSSWIDGTVTDDELRELNDRLKGDPEACEVYLNLMEAHAALTHEHGGEAITEIEDWGRFAEPQASTQPKNLLTPFRNRPAWQFVAAAAIVLLLNLVALWGLRTSDREEPILGDGGVAVLSRLVNPEWDALATAYVQGDSLPQGDFHLRSGLAQIEFFSGATMIVEGPAKLDLESAWRVNCESGKLRTFVPEPAQGFTIVTPDFHAVDLGTEFALSVGSDGSREVLVVVGLVRLDDAEGRELQEIGAGTGIRSRDGGVLEAVAEDGAAFIDREQLLRLAQDDWQQRYASWQKSRDAWQANPATVLLFDFEAQPAWDRQLENRHLPGSNGAIIGAQWTQGRWPGKGALEFQRITDRVRVQVPGEFESLTLAAWVRIEGLDRWLSSLLLTDGFDEGEVHWQISNDGELILGIGEAMPFNHFSPPKINPRDLGRWLHLAVTVDRESKTVTHFLDGKAISQSNVGKLPPLRIGAAEIGNWQAEERQEHVIRSLNGRIDEFVILDRALSESEVRTMHHAGMPNG